MQTSNQSELASGQAVNAANPGASQGFAIVTHKLTKSYGPHRGIIEVDLAVQEGEVFGFLGPNGAGKTTTIRLLLNLIKPTSGSATVLGRDSGQDSVEIMRHTGYLPGEFSLYPGLTGAETLAYFANLRGLDHRVARRTIDEMAARLELDLTRKFKQYSRGNKQKVGIIQAFLHRPRLLVLDEPTSGLDPLNQQEFYRMVREVQQSGTTIFFSSHIMSEVEKCCDRVAIIREGQLVRVGHLSELTGIKAHFLELTFAGTAPVEEFRQIAGVEQLEVVAGGAQQTIHCVVKAEALNEVVKAAARFPLVNFVSREPSLEETFLDYYRN